MTIKGKASGQRVNCIVNRFYQLISNQSHIKFHHTLNLPMLPKPEPPDPLLLNRLYGYSELSALINWMQTDSWLHNVNFGRTYLPICEKSHDLCSEIRQVGFKLLFREVVLTYGVGIF